MIFNDSADFRTRTCNATSPDNYLDMINELLIRLLLVEQDNYVIKVLSKETRHRLSALSLYLKSERLRKSNFRKAIAKVCRHKQQYVTKPKASINPGSWNTSFMIFVLQVMAYVDVVLVLLSPCRQG